MTHLHEEAAEAVVADYADRAGYDPAFVGPEPELRVDLPTMVREPGDVLAFEDRGATTSELRYEHFSVTMSRARRLCLWSAVNVSGTQRESARRASWRIDPRIARDAQTTGGEGALDVFGDPPKFARGHMTRRQDPIWGEPVRAALGNKDSMHYTNAVPQMQPFNGGIWLGLEDYALAHTIEDRMRICVFTGPVLDEDDPVRFGVQIPLVFWKVIAFVHDDTGALTATGYLMSQATFVTGQEFVFGAHETAQRRVAELEGLTGLSFGPLAALDPLPAHAEELAAGPLRDFSQIVLV